MKLYEIKPLVQDMGRNDAKIDKFNFSYNDVNFEVIVMLEYKPFELLFGVVGYNFSFILKLHPGFELESLSNDVFYKLCKILNLKPSKSEFNSYKFLKFMAERIPTSYSKKSVQPHEVAEYKKNDVPDEDKIYFYGWKFYSSSERNAKNFAKTKKWLGEDTYKFCVQHNISSCWTDDIKKRKEYYSAKKFYDNK